MDGTVTGASSSSSPERSPIFRSRKSGISLVDDCDSPSPSWKSAFAEQAGPNNTGYSGISNGTSPSAAMRGSFSNSPDRKKSSHYPGSPGKRMTLTGSPGSPNARKKACQEPYAGRQPPIKNVFDILEQTRVLVGMIQNVWGWSNNTTTLFRNCLPGLCRVHVGKDVFILPGYLLQDVSLGEHALSASPSRKSGLSHTSITDPSVQEVYVQHHTFYFPYIILLLKLRWLLRLHSACCELDYKMCSLKNLIMGLQVVCLQQHAEAEADSGFDGKVVQHIGSHVNLESALDDITDQLQRALGKSWNSFLEFVSTCDPSRSAHGSQMDRTKSPIVVSNDYLASVIDVIFVADFLRQPRTKILGRLDLLYGDLKALGIPEPVLPPLRGAAHLRAWAIAKTKPTRKDREKGGGKQMEKLAQVDFVTLTCGLELHHDEVKASEIEIAESTDLSMASLEQFQTDATPQISDFRLGTADEAKPASAGPPAARVIIGERPRLTAPIFEAAHAALQHHITFPDGIRERVFKLLVEEFGLTEEQSERVGIATAQNIEGHRLPEQTLLTMVDTEKVRIRNYEASSSKDCSHLLVSSLVPAPCQKGMPTKYMQPPPVPPRPGLPGSAFGSVDMTRSLPDLRGFRATNNFGRQEFKVPLSTGPLTMDTDTNKLRTTGFFIKMPPLKFT